MNKNQREEFKKDYIENVYKKSWTYAKLTTDEQQKITDILYSATLFGNNEMQLAYEMECIYSAFLDALNYKPIGWREQPNKIQRIENLIDNVLASNFCENDAKQYIDYLYKDLKELQELKENTKLNEDECLVNHCIESIVLLQEIICIVKGVKE